jgi:alcohol dehydrogenase
VHALTGKASENNVLTEMGAKEIIDRNAFMESGVRPLDKAIYAGGIDTVGGDVLSKMLSMINNGGAVSCCGNVAGAKFTSSVFPFILRGVSLFGIDSAESDIELKKELWGLLSSDWFVSLGKQSRIVELKDIEPEISKILEGKQIGRVVIKHGE